LDEREGLGWGGDVAIILKRAIRKNKKTKIVRGGSAVLGNAKACRDNRVLRKWRRKTDERGGGRNKKTVRGTHRSSWTGRVQEPLIYRWKLLFSPSTLHSAIAKKKAVITHTFNSNIHYHNRPLIRFRTLELVQP
jgi:hypothetical protein